MSSLVENPATRLHNVSQLRPASRTGKPPFISASRPKIRRKDARVRENALAGHVVPAAEMLRSVARVGRMTVNPE
jgi:hypothetical protein